LWRCVGVLSHQQRLVDATELASLDQTTAQLVGQLGERVRIDGLARQQARPRLVEFFVGGGQRRNQLAQRQLDVVGNDFPRVGFDIGPLDATDRERLSATCVNAQLVDGDGIEAVDTVANDGTAGADRSALSQRDREGHTGVDRNGGSWARMCELDTVDLCGGHGVRLRWRDVGRPIPSSQGYGADGGQRFTVTSQCDQIGSGDPGTDFVGLALDERSAFEAPSPR
jgi:hypothetical protein